MAKASRELDRKGARYPHERGGYLAGEIPLDDLETMLGDLPTGPAPGASPTHDRPSPNGTTDPGGG